MNEMEKESSNGEFELSSPAKDNPLAAIPEDDQILVKRKRGRPPKPKPPATTAEVDVAEGTIVKRKRGRPPKPKPVVATELAVDDEKVVKRKRGRPPKAKPPPSPGVEVDEESETKRRPPVHISDITDGERNLGKTPRKRGRPPKQKPLLPDQDDGLSVSTTPKKRGRPRVHKQGISPNPVGGAVPKKRGRPPKPKQVNEDPISSQQVSIPKKKRGRPPKPKVAENSDFLPGAVERDLLIALVNVMNTSKERIQQLQEIIPKKKRGRPPKPKIADIQGTETDYPQINLLFGGFDKSSSALIQDGTVVKRKRGRPKKSGPLPPATNATFVEPVGLTSTTQNDNSDESEDSDGESSADGDRDDEVSQSTKKLRSKKPEPKIYARESEVHELLKCCGVGNLAKVCKCLKAGIMNGFITLLPPEQDPQSKYGLEQIVVKGECQDCTAKVSATINQILYQGDIGSDYESGSLNAKVFCPNKCGGLYVGGLCMGDAKFDSGKFYNHCAICPRFGMCIYDCRETHCINCDEHYPGACPNCNED